MRLVSMDDCNLKMEDPDDEAFDADDPSGTYKLEMADPYENAVARTLLLLANSKRGMEIKSFSIDGASVTISREGAEEEQRRNESRMDDWRTSEQGFKFSPSKRYLESAFGLYDSDNSGDIETKELDNLLTMLGQQASPEDVQQLRVVCAGRALAKPFRGGRRHCVRLRPGGLSRRSRKRQRLLAPGME